MCHLISNAVESANNETRSVGSQFYCHLGPSWFCFVFFFSIFVVSFVISGPFNLKIILTPAKGWVGGL